MAFTAAAAYDLTGEPVAWAASVTGTDACSFSIGSSIELSTSPFGRSAALG